MANIRNGIYRIIFFICFCFVISVYRSQKLGLVLSGGGADALAHIGVLKALEEEGIRPDYVTGSSLGALIGGFYVSGISPAEMEKMVKSDYFKNAAGGKINFQYGYFYKERPAYASWLTIRFDPTRSIIRNLPVNVINSIPIEYYLMENFSFPSIAYHNNFDSLFVPFRCIASDITNKRPVVFRNGHLAAAIRASMSYPFYLRPFYWNNSLLYDGGLYENFPVQTMINEFNPRVILGSDVSEKISKPDEDDLYGQIRKLITNNTDSLNLKNTDTFFLRIQPNIGLFGFDYPQKAIDSGYASTKRILHQLKKYVPVMGRDSIESMRQKFLSRIKLERRVDSMTVHGNIGIASKYIERSFYFLPSRSYDLSNIKKRYFRLAADDRLKSVFPVIEKDSLTGKKVLHLFVKKEKPFYLEAGAMVSNRPVSFLFSALEYHHLGKIGITAYANGYLGKLMSGGFAKVRLDFPGRFPFYLEPHASYSRWDYFSTSLAFFDLKIPPFLIHEDQYAGMNLVTPAGNLSILNLKAGWAQWNYFYYQVQNFKKLDTLDKTNFPHFYSQAHIETNTLNKKMYPNEGFMFKGGIKYIEGREKFIPGNISPSSDTITGKFHHWFQVFSKTEFYLKPFKFFRLGFMGEVVYGGQTFFSNYYSSILAAPVFEPIPELRTFFYEKYRAHSYFALGGKAITIPFKNLEIRGELYYYQPFLTIVRSNLNPYVADYSVPLLNQYIIASAFLVYQTPVGPLSLSLNYVDRKELVTVFFHFGYLLFNKKSSEF
ncbi:MAG: patatin-like phospholipase family protein [Bacteroidia bacterium]|nr:patatin-like phospholipase family protein [Bacteroidia bacterium]